MPFLQMRNQMFRKPNISQGRTRMPKHVVLELEFGMPDMLHFLYFMWFLEGTNLSSRTKRPPQGKCPIVVPIPGCLLSGDKEDASSSLLPNLLSTHMSMFSKCFLREWWAWESVKYFLTWDMYFDLRYLQIVPPFENSILVDLLLFFNVS